MLSARSYHGEAEQCYTILRGIRRYTSDWGLIATGRLNLDPRRTRRITMHATRSSSASAVAKALGVGCYHFRQSTFERGGMKNLFQQETVSELMARIDTLQPVTQRSEERRVGKECRS